MTLEQRRQALDFGKIRGTGMPVPSGMSSVSSRAHTLNIYYETSVVPPIFFWRNKNRLVGAWTSKSSPVSSWRSKTSPVTSWKGKTSPQDGGTQEI
jgi:hypothetical protein